MSNSLFRRSNSIVGTFNCFMVLSNLETASPSSLAVVIRYLTGRLTIWVRRTSKGIPRRMSSYSLSRLIEALKIPFHPKTIKLSQTRRRRAAWSKEVYIWRTEVKRVMK